MTHAEIVEALTATLRNAKATGPNPTSQYALEVVIERALTALQAAPQDWRPIETAPKDGSEILVWDTDVGHHEIARWSKKHSLWHEPAWGYGCEPPDKMDIGYVVYYPTHWRPLPPPPGENGTP